MFEYKMNFDEEYARLVAPMLSPEQRTWYTSFTSSSSVPATWNQFKSAIKARYGVAVMEERNRCAFELMNIRVMPGESVPSFINRFMELLHWCQDPAPTAYQLSQRFLSVLPWALCCCCIQACTWRSHAHLAPNRHTHSVCMGKLLRSLSPPPFSDSTPLFTCWLSVHVTII